MPIRLNLLAEAQSAEDSRRRDPVKRALWVAALLISLMLVWSSSLQLKAMMARGELARIENSMSGHTNEYRVVLENQRKTDDLRYRIGALTSLATNRFLQASALNALQHTAVDDVQLVHYRTEQIYALTEGTPARTNENRVVPGKPGSANERVIITLEGSDSSANPGDQVAKFKETLATHSWFREALGRTNLVNLKSMGQKQMLPMPGMPLGKECILFAVECRLPEKNR